MRFDFTHYGGLKADEIRDLEHRVNERVLSNYIVNTKVTTVEEAMSEGAMALFGEKYGDDVRMVTIGEFSKELCGGTHCATTGEVGAFLIGRESSTAAGIRRIEAVTGQTALDYVQQERKLIQDLTSSLKISREDLLQRIQELIDRNKKLEKEIEKLKTKGIQTETDTALFRDEKLQDGKRIYVRVFEDSESDQLGNFVDETFRSGAFAAVVASSVSNGAIAVRVGEDKDAAKLLRNYFAPKFGGGGGGRKDFAKGGLKKTAELPPSEFLEELVQLSQEVLL